MLKTLVCLTIGIILLGLSCVDPSGDFNPSEDELTVDVLYFFVNTQVNNDIAVFNVKAAIKNYSDQQQTFIVLAEVWAGDQLLDSVKESMTLANRQTNTIVLILNGPSNAISYATFRVSIL